MKRTVAWIDDRSDFIAPGLKAVPHRFINLFHRNQLHADVVPAGGKAVVEGVDAGAAGKSRMDNMGAAADGAEERRRLRSVQDDAVDVRHGGEMPRSAVIGDQYIG